jgi:hypothetical protein
MQTAMQRPPGTDGKPTTPDEAAIQDINIRLDPPDPLRLFQLESEQAWKQRIKLEAAGRSPRESVTFPDEPVLTKEPYYGRNWPARCLSVEPNYVGYKRLLFEEKNSERYGWDLGPLGTVVSAGVFYKDIALLPYHLFTDPLRCYEYSTGYCLPGDPVPYLLYPPELSESGAVAEAAAVVALLAIFP